MDKVIDVDIIEDERDKSEKKDFIPPEILYDPDINLQKRKTSVHFPFPQDKHRDGQILPNLLSQCVPN